MDLQEHPSSNGTHELQKISTSQPADGSLPDDHYFSSVAPLTDAEVESLPTETMVESRDSSVSQERETWSRSAEFVLSCVGFAIGLGNVWRFPYLCYNNGGGAFLIPYLLCLVLAGVPLFFLEISIGQFSGIGGVAVWNITPILKGIGMTTTVILSLVNPYYIVILAWDGFYLAETLASIGQEALPWATCGNEWNTWRCITAGNECLANKSAILTDAMAHNTTLPATSFNLTEDQFQLNMTSNIGVDEAGRLLSCDDAVDAAVEYFSRHILQISGGVDEVGGLVWQLVLSLLFMWVACYFCIWRGVRWTGKIVYFTATFPYLIITILVIRGVTLPGAVDGLTFYLKPNFTKLGEAGVWLDAGTQIFYSYAVGMGVMTALGSYNTFKNNCYKHAVIVAAINSCTSLFAGLAIFSVLGFMAHDQQVDISKVADKGPGLAFIAYPKAVATMPVAQHVWAILFFLMIVFVGLDSQFVGVEGFVTIMMDTFPSYLRRPGRRELFTAAYCLLCFLVGLTMVTNGGMYVFQLFDYYSVSGLALLWVSFFESVAVGWVYGGRRFYKDIEAMVGYRINPWFLMCWTVFTPIVCVGIFLFMCVKFQVLTYNEYEYPAWANALGLLMAFSSMVCIPAYAAYALLTTPGTFSQRWTVLTTPILTDRQTKWQDIPELYKLTTDAPTS